MSTPAPSDDEALSYEDFEVMARRVGVDRELWEELYPMVRDLLGFAGQLNRLAPELGQEIELGKPGR